MMNFDDFKRLDFDSSRSFISGMKEHRACSVELFCSVLQNTEQNTKIKFLTEHRTEQNTNFCFPKNIYARLAKHDNGYTHPSLTRDRILLT